MKTFRILKTLVVVGLLSANLNAGFTESLLGILFKDDKAAAWDDVINDLNKTESAITKLLKGDGKKNTWDKVTGWFSSVFYRPLGTDMITEWAYLALPNVALAVKSDKLDDIIDALKVSSSDDTVSKMLEDEITKIVSGLTLSKDDKKRLTYAQKLLNQLYDALALVNKELSTQVLKRCSTSDALKAHLLPSIILDSNIAKALIDSNTNYKIAKEVVTKAWKGISEIVSGTGDAIKALVTSVGKAITNTADGLMTVLEDSYL